jgi:fructose-specific phosphotransferase system IIC component
MMCFDLGGPVNKVAYAFAVAGLPPARREPDAAVIMGAVMAAAWFRRSRWRWPRPCWPASCSRRRA